MKDSIASGHKISPAEIEKVTTSPSPASYNTIEAYNKLNSPRSNIKIAKDKRKNFTDEIAKLNISLGP